MLTSEQITSFITKARAAGFNDAQIASEIARKQQESVSVQTPQTQSPAQQPQAPAPQQQQPQAQQQPEQPKESGNFVSNFIKTLTAPAVKYAKHVGEGFGQGARYLVNRGEYEDLRKKLDSGNITEEEAKRFEELNSPIFMTQKELEKYSTPGGAIKETVKATAGGASYVIPGGATLKTAVAAGAVSGALFGLSEGEDIDVDKIISGAVGGAVGGAIVPVGGKIVSGAKSLIKKGGQEIADKAAQGINRATPTMWQKALEDHGVDLNALTKKYFVKASNYDDMLGKISERGNGGRLGQFVDDAEKQIATELKATSSNTKILMNDFIKQLTKEKKLLADMPGNDGNIAAIDEFIKAFQTKYSKGITPDKLLQLKRAADSQFGRAVVDENTGSAVAQAQKMFANAARAKLKALFPKVKDALDTETEIYTLRPILNRARAISKTPGSSLRIGKFNSLTDLVNPFTYLDKAMTNPNIASRFLNAGGKEGAEVAAKGASKVTAPMVNKALEMTGADVAVPNESGQDPTSMDNMDTTGAEDFTQDPNATDKPTNNPFRGYTKQQVLNKALAAGASRSDLEDISKVYDMFNEGVSEKPTSVAGATRYDLAQSGLRSLKDVEKIVYEDPEVLAKQLIPGQWVSREYDSAAFAAAEALLRMRSGAAVPEQEVRRYMSKVMPVFGDDKKTIKLKLQRLRENYLDVISSSGNVSDPALQQ